jgi:hypothetical protein
MEAIAEVRRRFSQTEKLMTERCVRPPIFLSSIFLSFPVVFGQVRHLGFSLEVEVRHALLAISSLVLLKVVPPTK